jgi:hypothetical protein
MTYTYYCTRCRESWIRDEEEPILPLPFYNPHRFRCPGCKTELRGELFEYGGSTDLREWGP